MTKSRGEMTTSPGCRAPPCPTSSEPSCQALRAEPRGAGDKQRRAHQAAPSPPPSPGGDASSGLGAPGGGVGLGGLRPSWTFGCPGLRVRPLCTRGRSIWSTEPRASGGPCAHRVAPPCPPCASSSRSCFLSLSCSFVGFFLCLSYSFSFFLEP